MAENVPTPAIEVSKSTVTINHLAVEDSTLAELLCHQPPDHRADIVRRALEVGARGVLTMGLGVDLAAFDDRVRRSVTEATDEASRQLEAVLTASRLAMDRSLDPDHRASLLGRAIEQFTDWRERFIEQVDPDRSGTATSRLLSRLQEMLGPGGTLEARLAAALDPTADGSGIARLAAGLEQRLTEIRDLISSVHGRRQEAERGTAKGVDFEDRVEDLLRWASRPLGAVVERTSRQPGALGADAVVGDFVVELAGGARIVVEAKNVRSLGLAGTEGVLAELDRAMANRGSHAAICVSAQDAFPKEVGPFGVYGNRILLVDDGDGTLLEAGLRWLQAVTSTSPRLMAEPDPALVADRIQRLRSLGQLFSTQRRALTEITGSVGKVQTSLEEMRSELLGLVDDLAAELGRGRPGGVIVDLKQVG